MSDHIKEFWQGQAVKHKQAPSASWGDNFAISLEVETIGKYLEQGDVVLDVGCANGFAVFRQFEKRKPSAMVGVDFSEEMIAQANERLAESIWKDFIHFDVQDVRKLEFENESFDKVYTTRCLINLPTWNEQLRGINECLRVCKKGGTVILSEGFWEPLQKLNAFRIIADLEPLVEHDFNRYIKKKRLESVLWGKYNDKEIAGFSVNEFSSVYYLGSRFLRELVTIPSNYEGYSNPINEKFYELEKEFSGGGFGIQQAYIIRK